GPRRTFSLHELGVRVLAGKLHATRTGGWQDIWLMAGVEIPAPDVTDGVRGVFGIRAGVAR
ncbi:MAG TPA: hypothetical protein VFW98_14980, partial [Gemmatimonadaceae bacterium]|nr:hypothetical protein [Gemmatimonadaceae bacterium]